MLVIGITGSFGTGKTTIAKIFQRLGAKVIDADKITHKLMFPHALIYNKLINNFGKQILKENSRIDRKKLARIVFSKKNLIKKLNSIVHPEVINRIKQQVKDYRRFYPKEVIVIDAPLLVEAGLLGMVDKLLVVKANKKNQIKRLTKSKRLSALEIEKRIKAQLPLAKKIRLADYVIDNNSDLKYTRKQVKRIWRKVK